MFVCLMLDDEVDDEERMDQLRLRKQTKTAMPREATHVLSVGLDCEEHHTLGAEVDRCVNFVLLVYVLHWLTATHYPRLPTLKT